MNERIRQLARQADLYAFVSDESIDPDIEKFAELIVQACANSLGSMLENATFTEDEEFDSGWVLGVEDSVSELRKHFGVEE